MFNIGFGEIAVICIIMIIALGPDRLPEAMKTVGKTLRTLRQASRDIRASTGIDELMRDDLDVRPAVRPPMRKAAQIAPPEGLAPVSRGVTAADVGSAVPPEGEPAGSHPEDALVTATANRAPAEAATVAPSVADEKPKVTEPS